MPFEIPEILFDTYYDAVDSFFTAFGVDCKLVSISKMEEVVHTPENNIPDKNSINAHRVRGGDFERDQKIIKEVETLEDVRLRVYWDRKSWINVGGNIEVPDGAIQTFGLMTDLVKVMRAKALIVHDGIREFKDLRFERLSEFQPHGFRQDRYFTCLWKRA